MQCVEKNIPIKRFTVKSKQNNEKQNNIVSQKAMMLEFCVFGLTKIRVYIYLTYNFVRSECKSITLQKSLYK